MTNFQKLTRKSANRYGMDEEMKGRKRNKQERGNAMKYKWN